VTCALALTRFIVFSLVLLLIGGSTIRAAAPRELPTDAIANREDPTVILR
jgi:hypothetical protein